MSIFNETLLLEILDEIHEISGSGHKPEKQKKMWIEVWNGTDEHGQRNMIINFALALRDVYADKIKDKE